MSTKIKNVHLAKTVDIDAFWDMMIQAVEKGNSRSFLNELKIKAV
jgi:hypothetical protein